MYYKHNSTTGGITVFGEKYDMACEYACSSLNSDNPVWARLYNVSTHFQSLHPKFGSQENPVFDIHEIDEEEYKNHLRFASKILEDAIEGIFHPTQNRLNISTNTLYDYSTYIFRKPVSLFDTNININKAETEIEKNLKLHFQLDVDSPFPDDYISEIRKSNKNAFRCLHPDGLGKAMPNVWPGREKFMLEVSNKYKNTLFTITCSTPDDQKSDAQEWREYYYNNGMYSMMPEMHYPAFDKRYLKPIE